MPASAPLVAAQPEPLPRTLHCAADDLYWNRSDGPECWFCAQPGVGAPAPTLTSQHGADFDEVERETEQAIRQGGRRAA